MAQGWNCSYQKILDCLEYVACLKCWFPRGCCSCCISPPEEKYSPSVPEASTDTTKRSNIPAFTPLPSSFNYNHPEARTDVPKGKSPPTKFKTVSVDPKGAAANFAALNELKDPLPVPLPENASIDTTAQNTPNNSTPPLTATKHDNVFSRHYRLNNS